MDGDIDAKLDDLYAVVGDLALIFERAMKLGCDVEDCALLAGQAMKLVHSGSHRCPETPQ